MRVTIDDDHADNRAEVGILRAHVPVAGNAAPGTVPSGRADIDAAWFTRVLAEAYPGVVVEQVELDEVYHGSAYKGRYLLGYREPGQGSTPPASVVVKAPFAETIGVSPEFEAAYIESMKPLNANEVRFYREVAPLVSLRTPGTYCAETDVDGHSVIVMSDLTVEGATFCDFDRPLGADDMAAALGVLARLHAKTWLHPVRTTFTDGFVDSGHLDMFLTEGNWAAQQARPRWSVVPPELDDWDRVTRGIRAAWDLKRSGDTCILHGDPHIENWYMDAEGRPGLLDWQLVSEGRWAWDLIYFMSGAMDVEARRASERDLVAHYLAELAGHGAPAPSLDDALADCARFAIWGLVVLLAPGGIQHEDFTIARVARAAQATLDWDSLGALGIGR